MRGEGVAYYVRGLEDHRLTYPTPLKPRDVTIDDGFRHHRRQQSLLNNDKNKHEESHNELDDALLDGVVGSSAGDTNKRRVVSSFSLASLDPRFRFSLREADIIQRLEVAENVVIGRHPDEGLRQLVWRGAPPTHRAECWRVLLDLSPANGRQEDLRHTLLTRKRAEYHGFVQRYYYGTHQHHSSHITDLAEALSGMDSQPSSPFFSSTPPPLSSRGPQERQILQQLALDLPRHKLSLFHDPRTVTRLERVLFLWSLRHPAVGFVQGIDDIMVQFFFVFLGDAFEERYKQWMLERRAAAVALNTARTKKRLLSTSTTATTTRNSVQRELSFDDDNQVASQQHHVAAVSSSSAHSGNNSTTGTSFPNFASPLVSSAAAPSLLVFPTPTTSVMQSLSWRSVFSRDDAAFSATLDALTSQALDDAEADAYWCGGRMLSWVQENFVSRQPGLLRMMNDFNDLVKRIDPVLHTYLCDEMLVALPQACFQWLHCMLTRELPGHLVLRLWDTYLAIGPEGFRAFHLFVCSALLQDIRKELLGAPFDVIMTTLKSPKPEEGWALLNVEWLDALIAQAYVLSLKYPTPTTMSSSSATSRGASLA